MWYEMNILPESDSLGFFADVHIPADSPWFSGHFPGHPVLPGIAQLGIVMDLIRQCSRQPVEPVTVSRVRFKKLIEPHDRIRVEAVPKQNKAGVMAFRILMGDELVSSGVLTVRPAA